MSEKLNKTPEGKKVGRIMANKKMIKKPSSKVPAPLKDFDVVAFVIKLDKPESLIIHNYAHYEMLSIYVNRYGIQIGGLAYDHFQGTRLLSIDPGLWEEALYYMELNGVEAA